MFVVVYAPESYELIYSRELSADEIMDERVFADYVAGMYGTKIDDSDGYIPSCSGNIRVEFRRDPNNAVCIYSGESFYFKREDF